MNRETPFLYIEDVMDIYGCCSRTARKRIRIANQHLKIPDLPYISINGFCKAYEVSEQRLLAILEGKARKLSNETTK